MERRSKEADSRAVWVVGQSSLQSLQQSRIAGVTVPDGFVAWDNGGEAVGTHPDPKHRQAEVREP